MNRPKLAWWFKQPLLLSMPLSGLGLGAALGVLTVVTVTAVVIIPNAVNSSGAGGTGAPIIVLFALLVGVASGGLMGLTAGLASWLLVLVVAPSRRISAELVASTVGAFGGCALVSFGIVGPLSNWNPVILFVLSGFVSSAWLGLLLHRHRVIAFASAA